MLIIDISTNSYSSSIKCIMKDNQEKISKTKVFTQVIHILPPPLPNFSSDFKSIREWLLSICMGNTPDQPIDTYSFGLFESPKEYILSFVGENTYNEGENRSITRIEFKPTTIYFKLPESKYKSLAREQVLSKLITELQEFVKTEQFKTSFLTQSNTIKFRTNGQIIWSKR